MSRLTFIRRRAERLAQLLDEAEGGRRHHARDRVDEDLAELVAVGHRISALKPSVEVEPEFRAGLRAMLIATAERDGIGVTARPEPDGADAQTRPQRARPATVRRARARGAIVVGVIAGAVAVSGMSTASENAVPGDALYGVKRSTERAQLALASSDLSRGQLSLDFARIRLGEAKAVLGDSAGFAAVLNDMDNDTRQGVKLMTSSAMQRHDAGALDAITAFVASQRPALAELVERAAAGDRVRAQESLSLLDAVGQRAEQLRKMLSCGNGVPGGADALGPLPQSCATAAAPSRAQPSQRLGPPGAPVLERTTSPTPTAGPTDGAKPSAPASPPDATEQPTAEPSAGLLSRLLDGILG